MLTRISRRAFWRPFGLAVALVAFQAYLGYSAIGGQFGVESQRQMQAAIVALRAKSARLAVEVESYRHRASLYAPESLDPDILTEQARALLSMANPNDIVVMLDDRGSPITGSSNELP